MTIFAALLSILVFMLCLKMFGVVKLSENVLVTSRHAVGAMRNDALDEIEREKIIQQASIRLLSLFLSLLVRVAAVLIAAFVPIWLISLTGVTSVDAVFSFLSRWDVIVIITLVMIAAYVAWARLWSAR